MNDEATPRDGTEQRDASAPPAAGTAGVEPAGVDELIALVRRLERFATEESSRLSHGLLPRLEAHGREHLWTSLLVALGLGVIVGMWLSGCRRGA